jgi:hypothetical protein
MITVSGLPNVAPMHPSDNCTQMLSSAYDRPELKVKNKRLGPWKNADDLQLFLDAVLKAREYLQTGFRSWPSWRIHARRIYARFALPDCTPDPVGWNRSLFGRMWRPGEPVTTTSFGALLLVVIYPSWRTFIVYEVPS